MLALAPRPEIEQAVLRLTIGTLVLLVLLCRLLVQDKPSAELSQMVWFLAGFVTFSGAIILLILSRPQESPLRRILVMIIADNTAITYFIFLMRESGVLVLFLFLFVAFGNGLRYGRLYLHISQGLALVGSSVVLLVSDYWSQHIWTGAAWLLALLVLPTYVEALVQRINKEHLKTKQALKECLERERRGS